MQRGRPGCREQKLAISGARGLWVPVMGLPVTLAPGTVNPSVPWFGDLQNEDIITHILKDRQMRKLEQRDGLDRLSVASGWGAAVLVSTARLPKTAPPASPALAPGRAPLLPTWPGAPFSAWVQADLQICSQPQVPQIFLKKTETLTEKLGSG